MEKFFSGFLKGLKHKMDEISMTNTFVYMDNLNIHKFGIVEKTIREIGFNVIYGVKYHFEHNLCELLFSNLKKRSII